MLEASKRIDCFCKIRSWFLGRGLLYQQGLPWWLREGVLCIFLPSAF